MGDQFVTVNLEDILVGEPLPITMYIYLDFRFITYRPEGDVLDRSAYDRLEFKKVKNLFIRGEDQKKFEAWSATQRVSPLKNLPPEHKEFGKAREDVHRKALDIFQSPHPDRAIAQSIDSSKKLVNEVMKFPFAVSTLSQLQNYSKGTVDHSVNVSILSIYLAMQMGYSHALILQHVGMGGLLHDVGKTQVQIGDMDSPDQVELKMKEHPALGLKMLETQGKVPNEVKMIVAQHHENYDGTGFPKKLRGTAIYDLARIVSIANVFDGLVGDGKGTLAERQRLAITQLDQVHYRHFDPQKLDKCLKILRLGI